MLVEYESLPHILGNVYTKNLVCFIMYNCPIENFLDGVQVNLKWSYIFCFPFTWNLSILVHFDYDRILLVRRKWNLVNIIVWFNSSISQRHWIMNYWFSNLSSFHHVPIAFCIKKIACFIMQYSRIEKLWVRI